MFISHATADSLSAAVVKESLQLVLSDRVELFSSSSPDAIRAGADWFREIENRLASADALVVVVTATSLERLWLWFEIGVVWLKWLQSKCRIYPICADDVEDIEIPSPLLKLQVRRITDDAAWQRFLKEIALQFGIEYVTPRHRPDVARMLRTDPDTGIIGPVSVELKYAWQFIRERRSPRLRDEDGTLIDASENPKFVIVARLLLGILAEERDEAEPFTSAYLYMRVVKALSQIINFEQVVAYSPTEFLDDLDLLKLVEVVWAFEDIWNITALGAELIEHWPTSPLGHFSAAQIRDILRISESFESPALQTAEEALSAIRDD